MNFQRIIKRCNSLSRLPNIFVFQANEKHLKISVLYVYPPSLFPIRNIFKKVLHFCKFMSFLCGVIYEKI